MTQTKEAKEQTMRAVALDRFGGPETLKVQTVPIPEAGADEILIHATSEKLRCGLISRRILRGHGIASQLERSWL